MLLTKFKVQRDTYGYADNKELFKYDRSCDTSFILNMLRLQGYF